MRERSERATARPGGGAEAPSDDAGCIPASALSIENDGAALHAGAALSILDDLRSALATVPDNRAGVRLHDRPALRTLLIDGPIAAITERNLGAAARPVRAILFDKSPATNWALGWHQDRTIAVAKRHEVPGYGP